MRGHFTREQGRLDHESKYDSRNIRKLTYAGICAHRHYEYLICITSIINVYKIRIKLFSLGLDEINCSRIVFLVQGLPQLEIGSLSST